MKFGIDLMLKRLTQEQTEIVVKNMKTEGHPHAAFANASHSLWRRFNNYTERNSPYCLVGVDGDVKAVIMLTLLTREPYANLYEIFAIKPTYARELYWRVMKHAKEMGAERLKMSCTPSSLGWHLGNGIVGWGVDTSGSIRVDIPICDSLEEQLELREFALKHPSLITPTGKSAEKLVSEENSFGPIKIKKVEQAISLMGDYYMRRHLL